MNGVALWHQQSVPLAARAVQPHRTFAALLHVSQHGVSSTSAPAGATPLRKKRAEHITSYSNSSKVINDMRPTWQPSFQKLPHSQGTSRAVDLSEFVKRFRIPSRYLV